VTNLAEPTLDDTELRASLIALQLQHGIDAERQRLAEERERERHAAELAELEERNARLAMAEAARLAGLDLDSQPARYFLHHYAAAGNPPDPERILRDYCLQVLGRPVPEAHRRRLQQRLTRS
jgi:hypothetical protein